MILIRKVKEPYGWLGNMAPFPVEFQEQTYKTTEALFQCLRFQNAAIIAEIREQKSPMAAKMIAKKYKDQTIVTPLSVEDVDNMRLCLWLKTQQHACVLLGLLQTGTEEIIEDCTKRPQGSGIFWGAALKDGIWTGQNMLGKIWMDIRREHAEPILPH